MRDERFRNVGSAVTTDVILLLLSVCLSSFCFGQVAHESVLCNVVSSGNAASASPVRFSVSVRGAQVSGLSMTLSQGARRIMILLDSSGSMGKSNSSITLAMQVVKDFVETSPASDQLALIDFANEAAIDIPLSNLDSFANSFADPKTMQQIQRGGGTAMFDAIGAAASYLHKTSAEGDSLFVVSDGLDNSSRMNQQKLSDTLLRDKVRVYLFLLGTPVDDKARKQLQETVNIVRSTGGTMIGVRPGVSPLAPNPPPGPLYNLGKAELEKVRTDVQTIHTMIEHANKLEFDLQPAPTGAADLQVSLANADGTSARDKQALCRTKIYGETKP